MSAAERGMGVIVPNETLTALRRFPFASDLHVTHAGYSPNVASRCQRPNGTAETILIFTAAGTGWVKVAGPRREAEPGDLVCVPQGAPHAYGSDGGWRIYWVHARGAALPFYRRELGVDERNPVVRLDGEVRIIGLFKELLASMEQAPSVRAVYTAGVTLAHLMEVLVEAANKARTRAGSARERVARTAQRIREHPEMTFSVRELAALAHLAPPYYAHLFKRLTGFAVRNFAIRCRLNRARSMLATTSLRVEEIAADLNYADPLYFSRQFRAFHGVSPSRFRRANTFYASPG